MTLRFTHIGLILLVIYSALLAGCANRGLPEPIELPHSPAVGQNSQQLPLTDPAVLSRDEIYYRLLVGEVAVQRGYFDTSIDNLLSVSQQVDDVELAERTTRIAMYAKREAAALQSARRWADLRVDSSDAQQMVAILALRQGDMPLAKTYFQRMLATEEAQLKENQAFLTVAGLLRQEGKTNADAALNMMAELIADKRDNPEALYAYGNLAMTFERHDIAEETIRHVVQMQPDFLQASILYARILSRVGELETAIQNLAALLQKHPENRNLRLAYSRMLLSGKRNADARQQFEVLLSKTPDDGDLIYTVGLLALDMGQYDDAAAYFDRLLGLNRRVDEAHYYLGRVAELRQEHEKAIEHFFNVIDTEYLHDAQLRIAQLMARMGRVDEARQLLADYRLENAGTALELRFYLAEADILSKHNNYAAAVQVLTAALQETPGNTDLLYARALTYERLDKIDLSEEDLRAVLLREPENADALNALGYTLADRTDRYHEAYELIQQAMKLRPNNAAITDSMGWVLYRLGRYEDALKYLQQALSLRFDAEIAAHLGEVLWVSGEQQAAELLLKQALEKVPNDKLLLKVIQQLQNGTL